MKKTILPILGILVLFFGFIFLCPGLRYYYWGDETRQVIPLTISLWHDIRGGTFGLWNFEMGFGASNAVHFLSYLGSPTFWLMLLVPKPEMIIDILPFTTVLSLTLAAIASWLWLGNLVQDETARFTGTVIMTFCGWAVFQFHYYSYLDAWMYICFLLYAMEEFLQGRKKLLFPLLVALITVLDLFTMYMASWLILFYMVTRIAMRNPGIKVKDTVLCLVNPFLYYLLGLCMAGAVFIMDAVVLLTSTRVGGDSGGVLTLSNLFVSGGGLFRLITSLFSPVINDYDFNIFSSPFQETSIRSYALFSYSFILCPLLLPQLAVNRKAELRPLKRILVVLSICSLIPLVYYVFNGNQASRWCFYFIVFHVMAITYLIGHREELDLPLLKRSMIVCFVLLLMFTGIALIFHTAGNRRALVMIVPCLLVLLTGYTVSLVKHNRKWLKLVLLAEALFCLCARVVNGTTLTIGSGQRAEDYEAALFDTSIIETIQNKDTDFYRIMTDEETAENYLLPMAKHFNGNSFYFSIYNPASAVYYHRRITEDWFIPCLPGKFLSYTAFGNRYLLAYHEDSFIPYGYELIGQETDANGTPVRIYAHSSAMTFGYADDHTIDAAYADGLDRSAEDYLLMNGILCQEGTQNPWPDERFIDLGIVNGEVKEYTFKEPGTLFIDYSSTEPYGTGSYELYRNGEVITYREFTEYGFHAVRIEEPCDAVGIYTFNSNFTAAPIPSHLYWLADSSLQEVYDSREQCDPLILIDGKKGNLTAEITVTKENSVLASSVPYDPGWKVYVDGEEREPMIVNTSFIGLNLEPGSHEIRFVYTPVGMKAGLAVSGIGILIYLVLCLNILRRNHAV